LFPAAHSEDGERDVLTARQYGYQRPAVVGNLPLTAERRSREMNRRGLHGGFAPRTGTGIGSASLPLSVTVAGIVRSSSNSIKDAARGSLLCFRRGD